MASSGPHVVEAIAKRAASIKPKLCIKQSGLLSKAMLELSRLVRECQHTITAAMQQEVMRAMRAALDLISSCLTKGSRWTSDVGWIITALLHEERRTEFLEAYKELLEAARITVMPQVDKHGRYSSGIANIMKHLKSMEADFGNGADADRGHLETLVRESSFAPRYDRGLKLLRSRLFDTFPENYMLSSEKINRGNVLGRGSFAAVHETKFLGVPCAACKDMYVEVSSGGLPPLPVEIQAHLAVKHPGIVGVLGYSSRSAGKSMVLFTLLMERMDSSLKDLIEASPPFPVQQSLSILLQVSMAMEILHSKDVIHRDLKTANILVRRHDNSLQVKIADFGLARTDFGTHKGGHTEKRGTKNFMAPEVYSSESYSKKADVYSFAMVCYHVLTGKLPYHDIIGEPMHKFFSRVSGERLRPAIPDGKWPADLLRVVISCWKHDPDERPSFAMVTNGLKLIRASMAANMSVGQVTRLLKRQEQIEVEAAEVLLTETKFPEPGMTYIERLDTPMLLPTRPPMRSRTQATVPEDARKVGDETPSMKPASTKFQPAPSGVMPEQEEIFLKPSKLQAEREDQVQHLYTLEKAIETGQTLEEQVDKPPLVVQQDRMLASELESGSLKQNNQKSSLEAVEQMQASIATDHPKLPEAAIVPESRQERPPDVFSLDGIIARLRDGRPAWQVPMTESEMKQLCYQAKEIFMLQPVLLELEAPIKICGDIHGQFTDLLRIFDHNGLPPDSNYLFLGNYVDFGKQSIETICLLLAYKIKHPENFFLLRGNHECASVNRVFGFYDECKRRFNIRTWKMFTDCFNCLPVCALIDERIFCVHGGLSPDLRNLDMIRRIARPTDVPDSGLLCDLLWADPRKDITGWGENDNNDAGVSYTFGPDIVAEFLQKHDLDMICRGHQVVEDGYEFFANRQLLTIFSAPNHRGEFDNFGATMSVDETLTCSFQIIKSQPRKGRFTLSVNS